MSLKEKEYQIRSEFVRMWESSSDPVKLLFNLKMSKLESVRERREYLKDLIQSFSELSLSLLYDEKRKNRIYYLRTFTLIVTYVVLMVLVSSLDSNSLNYSILISSIYLSLYINNRFNRESVQKLLRDRRIKRAEYEDELGYLKVVECYFLPTLLSRDTIEHPKYSRYVYHGAEYQYLNEKGYEERIELYSFLKRMLEECDAKMNEWSSH